MIKVTRKNINEYISVCLKKLGVEPGMKVDVAFGGEASPSGIWQGSEAEGYEWGGDFRPLAHVRKIALPGDWLDCYTYRRYGSEWDLYTNYIVRIPDPNLGISGECYEGSIGHPRKNPEENTCDICGAPAINSVGPVFRCQKCFLLPVPRGPRKGPRRAVLPGSKFGGNLGTSRLLLECGHRVDRKSGWLHSQKYSFCEICGEEGRK